MKNPDIQICSLIETKLNPIIDKINEIDFIFEADPLNIELRILDSILNIVCSNEEILIYLQIYKEALPSIRDEKIGEDIAINID
jgi:hypothetical protein